MCLLLLLLKNIGKKWQSSEKDRQSDLWKDILWQEEQTGCGRVWGLCISPLHSSDGFEKSAWKEMERNGRNWKEMEREVSPRSIWDSLCYFSLYILMVISHCNWRQCKKNHVWKKIRFPLEWKQEVTNEPQRQQTQNEWVNMIKLKCEDLQRVGVRGSEMKWILTILVYYTGYSLHLCHRKRSEIYRLPHCLPASHLCQNCSCPFQKHN